MKLPAALFLTDTHLHEGNIELVKNIWQQAIDKCKERGIGIIFFGGDFFTSRKAQSLTVDDAGREIINNVLRNEIRLYMIPGNHDKLDYESEKSYLDEYEHYENCAIVKGYRTFQLGELVVHLIPYFKESTVYSSYLHQAVEFDEDLQYGRKKHILLTHIAVTGVRNNDGSFVENNIDPDLFSLFSQIFVGHYHDRSTIGKNIQYIGSPYQGNFGENEEKGFTILFDDGSFEFVQTQFPKYVKKKIDVEDKKALKAFISEHSNSVDNIRIVLTGDQSKIKAFNKEELSSLGIDVKTENDDAVIDIKALMSTQVSFDRSNIKEAFEEFCTLNSIVDNKKGLKLLETILN